MTNIGAYSITMVMLLGLLIVVALLLTRYRDRLNARFGARARTFRASVDVSPGARLVILDVEGMTVVCGLNKSGITALHVLKADKAGGET